MGWGHRCSVSMWEGSDASEKRGESAISTCLCRMTPMTPELVVFSSHPSNGAQFGQLFLSLLFMGSTHLAGWLISRYSAVARFYVPPSFSFFPILAAISSSSMYVTRWLTTIGALFPSFDFYADFYLAWFCYICQLPVGNVIFCFSCDFIIKQKTITIFEEWKYSEDWLVN